MDASTFEKYLNYRLPETPELKVVSAKQAFPGMSRETWFVDTTLGQGKSISARGFIFRMDPPEGSIVQVPLRFEFTVYKKLQNSQVPVPITFWYEDDPEWLRESHLQDTHPEIGRLKSDIASVLNNQTNLKEEVPAISVLQGENTALKCLFLRVIKTVENCKDAMPVELSSRFKQGIDELLRRQLDRDFQWIEPAFVGKPQI